MARYVYLTSHGYVRVEPPQSLDCDNTDCLDRLTEYWRDRALAAEATCRKIAQHLALDGHIVVENIDHEKGIPPEL